MKRLLFCLLLLAGFVARGQVYNNEWIDYSKTYYKFKVGKNGVYRISQATLATAGLGSTPAEQFQLWRNGVQVPIYTSVASGALSGSDYIEFWGEMNDGKPDKGVYRKPEYQLNDKWSLLTDTAAYFLTVNPAGNNLRLVNTANNVAGNTLAPEPYFMYTVSKDFRDQINGGFAVNVGSPYYSSSYDYGEGWTSRDIASYATLSGPNYGSLDPFTFNNLYVYSGGPNPKFDITVSGNASNQRRYKVSINNDSVLGKKVDFFNYSHDTTFFPLSILSTNAATITVTNQAEITCYKDRDNVTDICPGDRMVVHKYEITYPRQFNFGGANNFEFTLSASAAGNYLEIAGFAAGSTAPVLYDLTNKKRYVGVISGSLVKVVLEPSAAERKLVLVNEETANVSSIATLQSRTFIDYRQAQNQGDYMIISNPALFNGPNGTNPVEDYRQYRSSANGGSYTAKTYLVDDLVDQFAFGIKKHPMGLRNFIMFARNNFSVKPKYVLLAGSGVIYAHQRYYESDPNIDKLNLVPTFGVPASDILLAADPGDSYPKTFIGRLAVISGAELAIYLKKVKDFEAAQRVSSPFIKDKAWMKNVVHVVGASEPALQEKLDNYMKAYTRIIADTLFGANVTTFTKSSPDAVQQVNNGLLDKLFEDGISLISYFGHSSTNTLEFNLNNPEQYNNPGKYPLFIALGCDVGNFYNFNPGRLLSTETLSEKFVLAENRGSIGFIAGTHLGIVDFLDTYNTGTYNAIANKKYGKSIGEIMQSSIAYTFATWTQDNFYARATSEEANLNGDPAITLNPHSKPDYAIEDADLQVSPSFVSIAEQFFKVKARFTNLGKAPDKSIVVQVKREYPNQTSEVVYRDTIPGIRFADSININIPIDALRDKGTNKLMVTVDADNEVDELFETNNSVTKEVVIFENEARPVYPYNYAIVNKQDIKFLASTADAFSGVKQYQMELDTTELFNSSLKISSTVQSRGGIITFNPAVSFTDSTVYYWRVGLVPTAGAINWNTSSFVYLARQDTGFNQSHFFQHLKSTGERIHMDSSSRKWTFTPRTNDVFIRHGMWVTATGQEAGVSVYVNGERTMSNACAFSSLVFNVIDPITFKPWVNRSGGLYGSWSNCYWGRDYNFEFRYTDTSSRRKAMEFMSSIIPDGYYVVVRNFSLDPNTFGGSPQAYAADWIADTAIYGQNTSLYHYVKNAGLSSIDSFYRVRPWALVYKKGDASFSPKWAMGEGPYDNITLSAICFSLNTSGYITSPFVGPARQWKQVRWSGESLETTDGDKPLVSILGVKSDGHTDTLYRNLNISQQTFDITNINADVYPYLQLRMLNSDTLNHTPYQLKYWRVTYTPAPEGAVAPNIYFSMKDTVELGEPLDFKIAFKNISDANFDSLKVRIVVTDRNNASHEFIIKHRPLTTSPDTLHVRDLIDTKQLAGLNSLYVDINPDNDQPEQYHFNNFIYKSFYVRFDNTNPLLDITFDNVHILNGDIVSSKPDILIKLKDGPGSMLLDDTALVKVKVIDPDRKQQIYYFNSDTLRFTPPNQSPGSENMATINFKPYFEKDGTYELIVSGKDKSGNVAGDKEYRIEYQVINKSMISNMLNYPNPFTTSTAFVFTLTGSEVPQNLKIQILTVTGKVVKEITKEELGTLRIGRNITDYKWDGTDQYGQKLANGVYLYRVVTNLNGKTLDKYTSDTDNTNQFFKKGYGKMYLMR